MGKTWVGHQEALYGGLQWILDIPQNYTSQFVAASPTVFPGNLQFQLGSTQGVATANQPGAAPHLQMRFKPLNSTPSNNSYPWTFDFENIMGRKPKMFGFDFGRVTEVYYQGSTKQPVFHLPPAQRGTSFDPSEKNLMRDLVLSCWGEDAEVSVSFHMFNPWYEVGGPKSGNTRGHSDFAPSKLGSGSIDMTETLEGTDITDPNSPNFSQTVLDMIDRKIDTFGDALNDWLSTSRTQNIGADKNVYVRWFHESNGDFFWWGPGNSPTQNFYGNFWRLWNRMVARLEAKIFNADDRARLRYVLSLNFESNPNDLDQHLSKYFPVTTSGLSPADSTAYSQFHPKVHVLGLDQYDGIPNDQGDWFNPLSSRLYQNYEKIFAHANRLGKEHALTEVGVIDRTTNIGKLYTNANPTQPMSFFTSVLWVVAKDFEPKWALFWGTRFKSNDTSAGMPSVAEYSSENPFQHGDGQLFTPAHARRGQASRVDIPAATSRDLLMYREAVKDFSSMLTRGGPLGRPWKFL